MERLKRLYLLGLEGILFHVPKVERYKFNSKLRQAKKNTITPVFRDNIFLMFAKMFAKRISHLHLTAVSG